MENELMKQSARQSLSRILDLIEESTEENPIESYVFLIDLMNDEDQKEGHINAAGLPVSRLDLAFRYINEETFRMVDAFREDYSQEESDQFMRGLAFNYIRLIIDTYDLHDPSIDLNNLKGPIQDDTVEPL